ncbi:hypothetical protein WBP06_18715 [Novosphingobium sp. BL-8H]|uniref:hypothetical protein n=1 Tax=Novosphingobium sp. BL-8H TaxID=3127640 RepID=UPI003757C14D
MRNLLTCLPENARAAFGLQLRYRGRGEDRLTDFYLATAIHPDDFTLWDSFTRDDNPLYKG